MLVNWETPVLVCSLTKAAAAEIAGRDMPVERGAVGTLHSHCYQQLGRPRLVTRDDARLWNVSHALQLQVDKFPRPRKSGADADADGLDEAPTTLEDSRVLTSATLHGQGVFDEVELLRHKLVPREQWQTELSGFYDAWCEFKREREREIVDFTDLIEGALVATTHAPGRPWVILADECQDLSHLEYQLLKHWGERAAATIFVGDPLQCIYSFRGASPDLFEDPDIPASHRRVLSQSYRVPRLVLEASVHWVRGQIDKEPAKYKPRADPSEPERPRDGWVEVAEHQYKFPRPFVRGVIERLEADPAETVMIQVTCAYMLIGILGELRYQGVPFSNPWKDRGDWNPLSGDHSTAEKLASALTTCSDSSETAPWTYTTVGRLLTTLKATGTLRRGVMKGALETCKSYGAHPESTPTALELEEWFGGADSFLYRTWVGEVTEREFMDWWFDHRKKPISVSFAQYLRYIVQRYGSKGLRDKPRVFCGTIHSFKGGEASISYVFPDLSPTAHSNWGRVGSEERAEIVREFYVAMTRSQEGLVICRTSSNHCAPLRREVDNLLMAGG